MIALGWTLPGAEAPHPLTTVAVAGCAAVVTEEALAATPQDRLRLQVRCVRGLPAFLPIAVRERAELHDALDHAERDGSAIIARLIALAGHAQITLLAEWQQEMPSVAAGPGWLRARAARQAENETRRVAVAGELRTVLAQWAESPAVVCRVGSGVQAHALICAEDAETTLAAVAEALSIRPALRDMRITATGPWPASAFVAPAGAMR